MKTEKDIRKERKKWWQKYKESTTATDSIAWRNKWETLDWVLGD